MNIAAFIVFALAQVGTKWDSIAVVPNDMRELSQFERYLQLKGYKRPIATSGTLTALHIAKEDFDLNAVCRDYASEFGVWMNWHDKQNRLVNHIQKYTLPIAGSASCRSLMVGLESSSPLHFGLKTLVKRGELSETDTVLSCTYSIRPWIASSGRIGVVATGLITIMRSGKVVAVEFGED